MTACEMPGETGVPVLIRESFGDTFDMNRIKRGCSREYILPVTDQEFARVIPFINDRECVLLSLFATELPGGEKHEIRYFFEYRKEILALVRTITGKKTTSIAALFPAAAWPERECRDMFGIEFEGAYDLRRLVLHEGYPAGFHPLDKSFANMPVNTLEAIRPEDEYPFRAVRGPGVYQVPVGPVHAGIIEPGHFRFGVIGETVFNLEIRLFYTHRGIEKLAEGKEPRDCLKIAEAVSGDESAANALAFCLAVERFSEITVPDRAWHIRTILCESERICSHLGDLAGMLTDVAFSLGASQFSVLREEIFRQNEKLSGSRFLRSMVCPGGISRDIPAETLAGFREYLIRFKKQFRTGLSIVLSTPSVIDRFTQTGVIKNAIIIPLNITGPVARASGSDRDVRLDHPYGFYDRFTPTTHHLVDGDVLSRFTVKASEVLDAVDLIEHMIDGIPSGQICSTEKIRDGSAFSLVESPRGENFCWVDVIDGKVSRYKVRTASYCNWLALEHAVPGNIIADFPVINKSLNLSYAGTDL